jgi:hypothetical protein
VVRLLAIQDHQLLFGGLPTYLGLEVQHRPIHRPRIHRLQRPEKSGLTGAGIPAVGEGADAQHPPLRLRQFFGERGQSLGPALGAAQYRASHDGQQRPQRIGLHAPSILWHLLEMLGERTDLFHSLGAAWGNLVCHHRQGRFEVLGLQAATSIFAEFLYEQPLGLAMLYVVIPAPPAPPIGQSQLLPAISGVNRAAKLLRIHEALHHKDRVSIALLPIRTESRQSQFEHPGTQIGHRPVRNQQIARVVDHQRQAPPPLLGVPTDPLFPMPQMPGRRAEHQHAHPPPLLIDRNIENPLPHWTYGAQIVMPSQQRLDARQLLWFGQPNLNFIQ